MPDEPLIRDVSDTARWVAVYRARESARPDALFRDPFAERLAGPRGEEIARAHGFAEENAWSFIGRTFLFDRFIAAEVARGVDLVVNLAAGLDARPYRMDLPPTLRWVEIDLPRILDYKSHVLADATPRCRLERIALDLSDAPGRRAAFDRVASGSSRAAVVCEGLLIYLGDEGVTSLGRDLAATPPFERWIVDIASPALLQLMEAQMSALVNAAGAPFRFAPAEGPAFFERCGWTPIETASLFRTVANLNRLPPAMQAIAAMPDPPEPWTLPIPWSAVCLFGRR